MSDHRTVKYTCTSCRRYYLACACTACGCRPENLPAQVRLADFKVKIHDVRGNYLRLASLAEIVALHDENDDFVGLMPTHDSGCEGVFKPAAADLVLAEPDAEVGALAVDDLG